MWPWPLRGLQNLLSLSLENTSWNEFLLILERCPWCMKPNAETPWPRKEVSQMKVCRFLMCDACSLQSSDFSLFNAKSHCFSRTGLPGMHIVSSPLLHWQWRVDSWLECVHCPISSMQAVCLGVRAATGIHFAPRFHLLMNSFLPLKFLKDDLEEYFKMLKKCAASVVQVLWRR